MSSNKDPNIKQIICSLILGADHPITPQEIQKILEGVAAERAAEAAKPPEVSDEELRAVQMLADQEAERAKENLENPEASDIVLNKIAQKEEALEEMALKQQQEDQENFALISEKVQEYPLRVIKKAIAELQFSFNNMDLGMELIEISGGYRFQTSSKCGSWVRKMLNKGKPSKLARPAIETLAIIAYRQPVSRSEIESIRGVSTGHVIKALMEMQLVRIIGRSDLPGRPFLFGTTNAFLDHFGLKSLKELDEQSPGLKK